LGLGFPAPPEPPPAPLARPPPPAAHRAPPAAPPAGAAAAAGLAAAATAAAAPVAPKGRFQRPVTSFFKAPATAEEKQRAAEQQAKEVEASRGKLQESAMEREKRQLEEKEAYRGPGRPKKNRFFSPPAGMCCQLRRRRGRRVKCGRVKRRRRKMTDRSACACSQNQG